jgi:hypothetical protein
LSRAGRKDCGGAGSCLFRSLGHWLQHFKVAGFDTSLPVMGAKVRSEICAWIEANPGVLIHDKSFATWIGWNGDEENKDGEKETVAKYVKRMRSPTAWGGGLDMAAFVHVYGMSVHVYEPVAGGG